jgi:serine phosphatase RsbU (regulator of sigma subunit)
MEHKPVPRYYGLRIYLVSTILYFFLVIPFLMFLAFQNIPAFAEKSGLAGNEVKGRADSLAVAYSRAEIDSMVQEAMTRGETDSILRETAGDGESGTGNRPHVIVGSKGHEGTSVKFFEKKGPFEMYFRLLFYLLIACFLAGLIYNFPFKRYFRLKRRERKIPVRLSAFCRKQLFATPVVNSLILTMPNIVIMVVSVVFLISRNSYGGDIERDLFVQFFYITLVATFLEFLFVYYWQRHRVHIKYIEFLFSESELRGQVFRRRRGRIRDRLLMASGMTTFFPLLVVMVYLVMSLTSIRELDLENISPGQREILIGPLARIIHPDLETVPAEQYRGLFYVNAADSIIMLAGIGTGIAASLIYLLLFIKWTNEDITRPVKELLANMRNTRGGETEHYTIVRTKDEIGELAEGYNEMTRKIHEYLEHISKMNRELEQKVQERTREVVMQKEEIEAQKEEIEAQLDLATIQRDTISRQKDQILDSIHYAERIQSALLPPASHLSEIFTDHFTLFKPRDIVSGDYFWTTLRGDRLMIAVADCTGHGVPGAFLSMLGISYMNEIVNRNESVSANRVLDELRDFVITSLHQTGSRGEARDGIEIALCIIHKKDLTMEYAGANRPIYLIREKERKGGDSSRHPGYNLIQIKGDRMPIGIYEQKIVPFTSHEITLKKRDALYLFSDGYVDQLGGPGRKTFRSKYFRELLLEIQDQPMEMQRKILEQRLEEWQGDVEQIDDILVMGVRV